MFEKIEKQRIEDKKKFEELDGAYCMICDSDDKDKQSLVVDCLCDVKEFVPEALSLYKVDGKLQRYGYYLRICNSCHEEFITMMREWANKRRTLRSLPKSHDRE